MASQANITVFDGASTPVSHTLVAAGIERPDANTTVAHWKETVSGLPEYAQIRASATKRKLKSGMIRCSVRVEVPVMEPISGQNAQGYTAPSKVAYTDTFESVSYAHERSTSTGRRLVRQLGVNLANGVAFSVTPVTSGPAPDLFDLLIQSV